MTVEPLVQNVFHSGNSRVCYTQQGEDLVVCGSEGVLKIFSTINTDEEPKVLDVIESASALAVSKNGKTVAVSSITGETEVYDVESESSRKVARSVLALRDCVFTHGDSKLITGGDDNEVILADLHDLSNQRKLSVSSEITAISYNSVADIITVSQSSGILEVFSLTTEKPQLITKIHDVIPKKLFLEEPEEGKVQDGNRICTKPDWHPDGEMLAIPSRNREICIFSRNDNFSQQSTVLKGAHEREILDVKWCPDGDHLASVGLDNALVIWHVATAKVLKKFQIDETLLNLSWGRNKDGSFDIAMGAVKGSVVKIAKLVEPRITEKESGGLFVSDDELEAAPESPDPFEEDPEDDFIIDDEQPSAKRQKVQSQITVSPYSQGCTPWLNDRRYITMNSVGYCWAVHHEGYQTVTVSFFDKGQHREYHFKDVFNFDLGAMTEQGVALCVSGHEQGEPKVMFRSHESAGDSWEKTISCAKGEFITCVSLSENLVVVATSSGYVRKLNLFGVIQAIEKTNPVAAVITNVSHVFTVTCGNGGYSYHLQDHDSRFFQRDLALPLESIKNLFFSENGDPCIVGQEEVLLILTRWRDPLQARWIPILDTKQGLLNIGAVGDNLSCWPLGVVKDRLSCIVVRGNAMNQLYPAFPLPLPSEVPIRVPVNHTKNLGEGDLDNDPEEQYVRSRAMGELLNDMISENQDEDRDMEEAQERLSEYAVMYDRSLLQMFAGACSEQNSKKALMIAEELREDKALVAASRIAERMELLQLVKRLGELRDGRQS